MRTASSQEPITPAQWVCPTLFKAPTQAAPVDSAPAPQDTGQLVPAVQPQLPSGLAVPRLPRYGSNHLLCVPSQNVHKVEVFRQHEQARYPGVVLSKLLNQPSDVPEQPFDDEGVQGAFNRTRHFLDWLASCEGQQFLQEQQVGHVVVDAMENFIACRDAATPSDHACVIRTDLGAMTCQVGVTVGVTVPRDCLAQSQAAQGGVTVGKLMAAAQPSIADHDWHSTLAKVSRYTLVSDLLQAMAAG